MKNFETLTNSLIDCIFSIITNKEPPLHLELAHFFLYVFRCFLFVKYYIEGLVMKKVVGTMFLMVVLLFGTHALSAEASGVETYMTPQSITNGNLKDNDITVSTNVGGTTSFQFNPGNGQG